MFAKLATRKSLIAKIAVAGCLLAGIPAITWAQSNPGFTIFSGVDREDLLNYHLDFGGQPGNRDRYRLYIDPSKLELAVDKLAIHYPDYFDGKFDTNRMEVRVDGESMPLTEVELKEEEQIIRFDLEEPIEPGKKIEVVLSNVKNPRFGGMYYFNCRMLTPGDIPLPRECGTWILSIGR